MPDLSFHVERAEVQSYAVTPSLLFKLHVVNAPADEPIHSVMLHCQVRIEPQKRCYRPAEQESLLDLFGLPVSVWRDMMERYYPNSASTPPRSTRCSRCASSP